MIPLLNLKKDMLFNGELSKVVDILKGISVARYYSLERQAVRFEDFFEACAGFLGEMDLSRIDHPFTRPRNNRTAVLMVTSNAGFLGGLNSQVLNVGLRESAGNGLLSVIGEKGADALRNMHLEAVAFPGIEDNSRFALAASARDHLIRQVLSGQAGRLVVVYPKLVSFAVQQVTSEAFVPLKETAPSGRKEPAGGIAPVWESAPDQVLEYVVTQWVQQRLAAIFASSRLSELAARYIHLEGSYQELLRRGKKLKHEYFRARHEVIDRSMREIFAAQLLYARSHAEEPS